VVVVGHTALAGKQAEQLLLNSEVAAARARVGSLRRSATVTGQPPLLPTGGCYLSVRVTCSAAATPLPPHFVAAAIDVADAE
jgi:hypothetical protein